MRKTTNKSAFTLVELIVVITILAVLGTIGFMSLQGYSADARNTKRTTDLNSFQSSISIKMAEGGWVMAFTKQEAARELDLANVSLGGTAATTTNYKAGIPNYVALGIKEDEFKDPNGQDYSIATTTTAGGRFELATSIEVDGGKQALVKGTYIPRTSTTITLTSSNISGKVITLNPENTNTFRTGDTVTTTGGNQADHVIKVAKDGITLTLEADATGTTEIKLKADETGGLIKTRDTTDFVVSGDTTKLPY